MSPTGISDEVFVVDPTYPAGYASALKYKILNQFGGVLPRIVDVNEKFSNDTSDNVCEIWPLPREAVWWAVDPTKFEDFVGVQTTFEVPPYATPARNPLGAAKVDHWTQEFRVGASVVGQGILVQRDTLQRYEDHARHENIVSPVP
jgi:hypothetical protein